jgi:hypothetical protein
LTVNEIYIKFRVINRKEGFHIRQLEKEKIDLAMKHLQVALEKIDKEDLSAISELNHAKEYCKEENCIIVNRIDS